MKYLECFCLFFLFCITVIFDFHSHTVLCIFLDFILHFSSFLPSFQLLNRSVNNIPIFLLSPFFSFVLHFALCFSISFFQSSILTLFLSLSSYALYLFSLSLFLCFFFIFLSYLSEHRGNCKINISILSIFMFKFNNYIL